MQELNEQYSKEEQYLYFSDEYYDPLLEYVTILAEEYCPVTAANYVGHYCSRAIGCFAISYFDNKIDESSLNKYLDSDDVQDSIKALGYDVEKFWYLILFVYDFTFTTCTKSISFDKSIKEKMDEIALAIIQNVNPYDENSENPITYKRPIKFTLEIQHKRKIVIDDPFAIMTIAWMFHNKAIEIESGSELDRSKPIKQADGKFKLDNRPTSVHIWYFAKLLLTFFELKPPIKASQEVLKKMRIKPSLNKKLLISRLIYILGITNKEEFLLSDKSLKGYLNKYKDFKMDNFNIHYN